MRPAVVDKMGDTGGEGSSHRNNKHCIRGYNHSCNLGGQAPKPPPDRKENDVTTAWTQERRRMKRNEEDKRKASQTY